MTAMFRPLTTEYLLGTSKFNEADLGKIFEKTLDSDQQPPSFSYSATLAAAAAMAPQLQITALSTDYLFGETAGDWAGVVNKILSDDGGLLDDSDSETEDVRRTGDEGLACEDDEGGGGEAKAAGAAGAAQLPRSGAARFGLRRVAGRKWKQEDDGADDDDDFSSSDNEGGSGGSGGLPSRRGASRAPGPASRGSKRKRSASKKEPVLEEYAEQAEFDVAWNKWREDRDQNNRSVKRSRERTKLRKMQEASRKSGGGRHPGAEGSGTVKASGAAMGAAAAATAELAEARAELALLCRYIADNDNVTGHEGRKVKRLVTMYTEPDGDEMAPNV